MIGLIYSTHAHLFPCLANNKKKIKLFYHLRYKNCRLCPHLTHTFELKSELKLYFTEDPYIKFEIAPSYCILVIKLVTHSHKTLFTDLSSN